MARARPRSPSRPAGADRSGADRSREVADRLHSAAIHLLRRVRREDQALGLTGARLSALSVLVFGGPASLGALARAEQVTAPTMSRIVSALVDEGLVTRASGGEDRRTVRIEATEKGRQILWEGRRLRVAQLAAGLERLAAGDLDRVAAAVEVLHQLLADPAWKPPESAGRRARFRPQRSGGRRQLTSE